MKTEKLTCPYCEKEFERQVTIYAWVKEKLEEEIKDPTKSYRRQLLLETLCDGCRNDWNTEMQLGICKVCEKEVKDAYYLTKYGSIEENVFHYGRCKQCVELGNLKEENEDLKKKLENSSAQPTGSKKTWW
jgi:hypothetical protein